MTAAKGRSWSFTMCARDLFLQVYALQKEIARSFAALRERGDFNLN